jgi:hypothetical protein
MLSENLKTLRSHLARYRDAGMKLHPQAIEGIVAILDAAIEDAEALESCAVAPIAQVTELPANVLRLATKLHRKGVRLGTTDGGPGSAA